MSKASLMTSTLRKTALAILLSTTLMPVALPAQTTVPAVEAVPEKCHSRRHHHHLLTLAPIPTTATTTLAS